MGSGTAWRACAAYLPRRGADVGHFRLGRARELCPDIQTVSYDFDLYSKISMQFYEIILSHADEIQPTSVDECIIDVSTQCLPALQVDSPSFDGEDTAMALAQTIRREILDATRCEVSIGISHNILLARLATRRAKPNNAFHLLPSAVDEHLAGLDIEDLPGVGWHQRGRIELALKTTNVGDLKAMPLARVQDALGENWGRTVHQYAKGIDARELKGPQQRKSVSAEINYGIRFAPAPQGLVDAERFIKGLGMEVERRLKHLGTKGRHLTLKIMRKAIDAGDETWKFLGHGDCDTFTKVARIAGPRDVATDDGAIVGDTAWKLLLAMEIPPEEMRGCAIQIQMLESSEGGTGQALLPFKPKPAGEEAEKVETKEFAPKKRVAFADTTLDFEPAAPPRAPPVVATQIVVPPMSQLDAQVIDSLPAPLQAQVKAAMNTTAQGPKTGPSRPTTRSATVALPSASQLDPAVLQELPPDVRAELEAAYRKAEEPPAPPPPRAEPKPSPKKKKPATITAHFAAAKRGGTRSSSKRNKDVALDPKQLVIAEGSQALKVAVRPAPVQARQITLKLDPSRLTDVELESLDIDPSFFREIRDRALQHEILSRRHAERPDLFRRLLGLGDSVEAKSNGVVVAMPLQVKTVPPPAIQGRASTAEVCALVEQWVDGFTDEAPDRRDVERVSTFLIECVDRSRGSGQDLGKAVEVVDWWALAVDMREEEMTPPARRAWRGALEDVKHKLNTVAMADHGAALFV